MRKIRSLRARALSGVLAVMMVFAVADRAAAGLHDGHALDGPNVHDADEGHEPDETTAGHSEHEHDHDAAKGGGHLHGSHGSHGPIGVMGEHPHEVGEVMLSYRFMYMDMDGNRDGTSSRSSQDIFDAGYLVAPQDMRMDMHMVSAMYGMTDRVTLMLMLPWIDIAMDHRTKAGGKFTTRANGVGDMTFSTLVSVWKNENHDLLLNLGLSFPTGSINQRDDTPMGHQKLPYPMQLGSGTYDILPGFTYTGEHDKLSWGFQFGATVHVHKNDNHYRLGDRYRTTSWASWHAAHWISTSLRLSGEMWENINGRDPSLNTAVVPTADPNLRGGKRVDVGLGVSLFAPQDFLEGHRIAIEAARPVYQYLDGPQLETDWIVTVGWEKVWQ